MACPASVISPDRRERYEVMFGIGFGELILVAVLALIFIGPDKLPEIAKTLGKAFAELRKAMREVQDTVVQKEKKE